MVGSGINFIERKPRLPFKIDRLFRIPIQIIFSAKPGKIKTNMSSFNSIYVKNAGLKSTSATVETAFSPLGIIERVDMVDFTRPDGSKGKNAFVHFSSWNTGEEASDFLSQLEAARVAGETNGTVWTVNGWRFYVLVNEKPLQVDPLNVVQLTKIVQEQRSMVDDLQMIIDLQTARISDLERQIIEIHLTLGGRSMSQESRGPSLCLEDLETEN